MEKFAFLFPGQGSQYIGMTKSFYDNYAIARQTLEEASDVLGFDLAHLVQEGSLSTLSKPVNMQPALLTASVVAFRVYMQEIGVAPEFAAGHSLGEYAALTCSGAIRFADAVQITRQRGRITEQVVAEGNGAMTILDHIQADQVEAECRRISTEEGQVVVSCYNADRQVAISGHEEAVLALEDRVSEWGGTVSPLFMSAPFHSPLMQAAGELLREELARHTFHSFRWPVISNVTGRPYPGKEAIIDLLVQQLSRPVQWQKTMQYLKKQGVTKMIEVGPKNVLSALVQEHAPGMESFSYDQRQDRVLLNEFFADHPVLKKHRPDFLGRCLAIAAATPNLNWDQAEYAQGVVEPYRRIEAILKTAEESGLPISIEHMQESFELLHTILKTKKVPEAEQQEWKQRILDETGTEYLFRAVLSV